MVPLEKELFSEDDDEMQPEPLERFIQFKQREIERSSDEEDIPLAELQRRLRAKEIMGGQQCKDEQDQTSESESDENPQNKVNTMIKTRYPSYTLRRGYRNW